MKDPYEVLGVPVGASPFEIKTAWRALIKKHHPDVGGEQGMVDDLNRAYIAATGKAKNTPCPGCDGIGRKLESSGFHVLKVQCSECGGTGKRWR